MIMEGDIVKKMDENTIGGRIRKARMDKKIKIKEFAAILQINPNYLGMVELGKKVPSKRLLERIAENTDASYDWLLKGPEDKPKEKISASSSHCTVASVDLQLLLPIIMVKLSYSKELIARFMGIDVADIDKIISGGEYAFASSWDNVLSGLAQQMDLDNLVEQLDTLTGFLRDKRNEKNDWQLFTNLQQYISKNFDTQYQLKGKIGCIKDLIVFADENFTMYLYPKQITFESETDGEWIFNYYKPDEWLSPDAYIVETVLRSQRVSDGNRLSIILADADLYHQFCICYKALRDASDIASDIMRIISIIHVDKATMKILDIYTSDSDEPSQNEMPDTPS